MPILRAQPLLQDYAQLDLMNRLVRLLFASVAIPVVACVLMIGSKSSVSATETTYSVVPYSATEIANPLRGQYRNIETELFPQSNTQQRAYAPWPKVMESSVRLEWKTLQPTDPRTLSADASNDKKYDFSSLDAIIARNAKEGRRTGFRVSAFNSCCKQTYPNNVNNSLPSWLMTVPGAAKKYLHEGVTHVIPQWNDESYLRYMKELITALGERYNRDERVSMYEFSGYGDFSENHVAFMRDTLKLPAVSPDQSEATLGYYSQYQDQYITKASIKQLADTTIDAFRDTQIVLAPGNPEIVKQMYSENENLQKLKKPVGNRSDCLGEYSAYPAWLDNQYSEYVKRNDPFIAIFKNRHKTAPIITEWCNFQSQSSEVYYKKALTDTVTQGVSMLSSTGFPAQLSNEVMSKNEYDVWVRANKYSGYRYAITDVEGLKNNNGNSKLPLKVTWANFGVAPTYESWKVQYEIVNDEGQVVRNTASAVNLKTLHADQSNYDVKDEPLAAKRTEQIELQRDGLVAGTYAVRVKVVWDEHKAGATNAMTYAPMYLALQERSNEGSYTLGTFTIGSTSSVHKPLIWLYIYVGVVIITLIGVIVYLRHRARIQRLGQ